jgi:hypothetical protein
MRGFKDLIARRRPVTGESGQDMPSYDDPSTGVQTHPEVYVAMQEPALTTDTPSQHCDIDSAREARHHVPRPQKPQPYPRQEWVPQATNAPLDTAPSVHPPHSRPKVWDIDPDPMTDPLTASEMDMPSAPSAAPAPAHANSVQASGHATARPSSTRVKTRLIGFHTEAAAPDVFASPSAAETLPQAPCFPIGWLVVTDGPGRGASFTLRAGLSTIGRDSDQTVSLDYGDNAISRERHVAIAYDDEENRTFVGHGGKANIVRHNDMPLLSTEELADGDTIKIGKTVLRYVAFCSTQFSWSQTTTADSHDG